ncbi:MAG: DNA-directed RNA polymerase subunit beta' [Bryobacterales bacterium]|nr:DNA-directed RNA polymerase subunit beta' [Bryobacterales bacterium]MDE0296556.1 DNA-directed RNA polymerase subunit beta' [Bryobacterales bacterium]
MFRSSPYDRVSLISDFDSIRIALASPEKIRSWSHGEVTKPETINYRTFKPERDGLFCAKIFGPVTDWECLCGKYKRMKHRGVICDKCGVEVTLSRVRRERLGHIELASPCSHVWFFKGLPSRIGQLLDITLRDLERVLYFEAFVVVQADEESELAEGDVLTDEKKRHLDQDKAKAGTFIAMMGAAGIKELLKKIDLDPLADELRDKMKTESSVQKKLKFARRLKVVESFRKSGNKPEWMILDVIPVIPPELRPLVPLDGGRFATSDLNDLYRRVINRNNRLKKLMELSAPDVIVRNEKRMLQEAVDALFDNGRRGNVLRGANNRPLKSLSDTLKGKQGRFRQNLLGKRVDYSGRSVIVVGPELKLHQCGLPKQMALELFKPFIYQRLEQRGHCTTIKQAKELVEQQDPVVWDILEEVIKDHPVLLNRAPTLHRLGIQAFEPVLVEGKAIKIHPLVCTAFNADFDGDQMAVHIPLSPEAQVEAEVLMLSSNNILSPANGAPITTPTQDMVLGIYYLTKSKANAKGEGRTFGSIEEVLLALEMSELETLTPIKLYYSGPVIDLTTSFDNQNVIHSEPIQYSKQYMETTVGRVILNDRLPADMPYVNGLLKKRGLMQLVQYCYLHFGRAETVEMIDGLKSLGFNYATKAGLSIGINDMVVPAEKQRLVKGAQKDVMSVEQQYLDGAITHGERYNKIIEIWSKLTEQVSDEMFTGLESSDTSGSAINPIYIMADSGARGSKQQIRQLSGMRGLMAKPSGEIIETPITANFREGLNVLQYFISTHGARKGLADTALKTADSGYLTRRLVDVAQDVIITETDCGTNDGIYVEPIVESGEVIEPLRDRIVGRVSQEQIKDYEGNIILTVNQEITEELAAAIPAAGIERVKIRSVLTCESERGVCRMCYGRNLATGRLVEGGEAVGVIAAQSIGEPGTQLTMRTFHIGGAATRVSEQSTQDAKSDGFAKFIKVVSVRNEDGGLVAMNRNGIVAVVDEKDREKERYQVVYGAKLCVEDGAPVSRHQVLLEWDPYTFSILTEVSGLCHFVDLQEGVTLQEQVDEVTGMSQWVVTDSPDEKRQPQIEIRDAEGVAQRKYLIPTNAHLMVRDGEEIHGGDVVAKIPRETTKTKDITGGLPRVVELFEARRPKETAVMSEIDGMVRYGEIVKGQRKIFVIADNKEEREYSLPRGVHINVQQGERVRAGEPLMDGPRDPHDILAILGEKELQKYLVNEIQEVYRLQGVNINDKHLEVIVRQMMRWIKVEQVGDSELLLEEVLDKFRFRKINQMLEDEVKQPAVGRPLLMGITKASLATDSFISAASFQETTRVLTEASVSGKVDHLRGLKENVIVGRLIPAGTGIDDYRKIKIAGEDEPEEMIPEIEYLSGVPGFGEEMPMDYPPGFGEELPPDTAMIPPAPVE